ncbi:flagellar assembly protein FliH [Shewanella sp. ULN5]|uniref:flagellar assembly protein FliH n=1 Tax=Shewanella sp. ULN5 TaxID=2994678 RepID=UPI00273E158E|nr:flagellar assembly protein FliH [Shewanella sp. ULN5]MDP5144958.1 flagellar assembly protein FliH [Shewanella sp. ULN5]
MTDSKISKKVLNVEDEHEFSHWQLPDVTLDNADKPSNLYGKKAGAYQSSTPAVEQAVKMPTMAQIEEIRADAEREGFEQGKLDGFQQGLEQGRLEGLAQGHEEGFAQGEIQGHEAGTIKAEQLIAQFTQLINQFEQPLAVLDAEVEAELLAMTLSLAKAVVQQELKMHPEHIAATIRQGVDALPIKEQRVKVRLHPEDVNLVTTLYGQSQLTQNDWVLESDPSLSQGDVFIESLRSTVNLTLAQRIEQIFTHLDAQSLQLSHQVNLAKQDDSVYRSKTVDDLANALTKTPNTDEQDSDVNSGKEESVAHSQSDMPALQPEVNLQTKSAPLNPISDERSMLNSDNAEDAVDQGEVDDKPSTSITE